MSKDDDEGVGLVGCSRVGSRKINHETVDQTYGRKSERIVLQLFIGKHRCCTPR